LFYFYCIARVKFILQNIQIAILFHCIEFNPSIHPSIQPAITAIPSNPIHSIMSATIMSPIHNISCAASPFSSPLPSPLSSPPPSALPLSRSAATYYVPSSSMLPRPSLLSWSLDHSRTTFQLAAAFATKAQHTKGHGASASAIAIASAARRLIDDDPDRDEEDHIRGIKRNRASTMVSVSPTIPSKRRCYPSTSTSIATSTATLMLPGMCRNYGKRDFDFDRGAGTARPSSEDTAAAAGSESTRWSSREGKTAKIFLPQQQRVPKPTHRHSEIQTKSDSGSNWCHDRAIHPNSDCNSKSDSDQDRTTLPARGSRSNSNSKINSNTATDNATDRDNDSYSNSHDESSHYTGYAPIPEPPGFRRHSTIRDSFDLAYSIDEFAHGLITS